ncbi:hypothetical protein DFQ26_003313 [Actinomortierella ambigua]|nr:hypothetical protein DFQ26_003313 [Actinomortierella ambigua]
MSSAFTPSSLIAVILVSLAFYSTLVSAQAGISIGCSSCIQQKLLTGVPQCNGVNLTDISQRNSSLYRDCICYSSFDFNWTLPCRDFGVCQMSDLTSFQQTYPSIFSALNLTCVKPTPTPTGSASRLGGNGFSLETTTAAAAASIVMMTMLAGGVGAFLATVGF